MLVPRIALAARIVSREVAPLVLPPGIFGILAQAGLKTRAVGAVPIESLAPGTPNLLCRCPAESGSRRCA